MVSPSIHNITTPRAVPPALSIMLKQRRNRLSLFRFAEESNLSQARWSDLEEGVSLPTETELWRLSQVLESPFQNLLLATEQWDHVAHVLTPYCLSLYGTLLEKYALYLGEEIDTSQAETLKNGSLILCLTRNWKQLRVKFPSSPRDTGYIVQEETFGAFRLIPAVTSATLLQAVQYLADSQ